MSSGLRRPVKPLDRVIRVSNVPITYYKGPAPRADCPCGSGQPARRFHCAEDLSWIALPPPALLTGARTGYANPDCYGRASNDCSEDRTREHFISDDVLESSSVHDAVASAGSLFAAASLAGLALLVCAGLVFLILLHELPR